MTIIRILAVFTNLGVGAWLAHGTYTHGMPRESEKLLVFGIALNTVLSLWALIAGGRIVPRNPLGEWLSLELKARKAKLTARIVEHEKGSK